MSIAFKGDIGTILTVTIRETVNGVTAAKDISAAGGKKIIIRGPNKTPLTRDAIFDTDGSDGKIKYVTVAADFAEDGIYYIQAYIELPGGKWHSSTDTIEVGKNLN